MKKLGILDKIDLLRVQAEVGNMILKELDSLRLPKLQILNEENKELLAEYKDFIYNLEVDFDNTSDKKKYAEELEEELFHVESFLTWKQEKEFYEVINEHRT